MKKYLLIAVAVTPLLFAGCAGLTKGADPIVVRVEQSETIAYSTFDTFLSIDNANRNFFLSNAPAFHQFAEYLRAPTIVNGTNLIPRGKAFIYSLDQVKLQYKSGLATSNQVANVLATLEVALMQAQQYIVSSAPLSSTNITSFK